MTTNESTQEHPWDFQREPGPVAPDASTDTTLLRFRLDALQQKVEQIRLKSGEVASTARRAVMAAMEMVGMRTMPDRGPDDFAPTYAQGFRDGRKMTPPDIGGVNSNSKLLTALVALNTALLIGVGGWVLATVARHDRELAVIVCQLNPQQCPQVNRGP